jgi:hypothetical protein
MISAAGRATALSLGNEAVQGYAVKGDVAGLVKAGLSKDDALELLRTKVHFDVFPPTITGGSPNGTTAGAARVAKQAGQRPVGRQSPVFMGGESALKLSELRAVADANPSKIVAGDNFSEGRHSYFWRSADGAKVGDSIHFGKDPTPGATCVELDPTERFAKFRCLTNDERTELSAPRRGSTPSAVAPGGTVRAKGSYDWEKVVVTPKGGEPLTLATRNSPFVDEADRLDYLREMHTQVKAVVDALRTPGVQVECHYNGTTTKGDASELYYAMFGLLLNLTNDIRQHPLFRPNGA